MHHAVEPRAAPLVLSGRLRLLPLPLPVLSTATLRLALAYQHELWLSGLEPEPAVPPTGLVRLVGGRSLGRLDLDGSIGFVLGPQGGAAVRPLAMEAAFSAALSLLGHATAGAPAAELRLQLEALARFRLEGPEETMPGQGALLLALLGTTASGYGGGLAAGAHVLGSQPGLLVALRLQTSWGPAYRNPAAERQAEKPRRTPDLIWELLGALDPTVGADGCIYTDPTPERPARRWFCIGRPAPEDPGQILLPDGHRLAVGEHLWELGSTLRQNDGTRVADIPLAARFRRAVSDYLERKQQQAAAEGESALSDLCSGRQGVLAGTEDRPELAAVLAQDDFGGAAALAGERLWRELRCRPERSPAAQAAALGSLLGTLRRGARPLAARPPPAARGEPHPEQAAAEHTRPAAAPSPLPEEARAHVFSGHVNKRGEAKGWHYEPSGDPARGTHVIEGTRSAPDKNGVYEANVMIQGVKKGARSSFFPRDWTQQQVEEAIAEAYVNRKPLRHKPPGWFGGTTSGGVEIEMQLRANGTLNTVYPLRREEGSR